MQLSVFWTALIIFSFQPAPAQSPKDIGQLFTVNNIVPDLLPAFNPSVSFQVTYNATVVPGQIFVGLGLFVEATEQCGMMLYIRKFAVTHTKIHEHFFRGEFRQPFRGVISGKVINFLQTIEDIFLYSLLLHKNNVSLRFPSSNLCDRIAG